MTRMMNDACDVNETLAVVSILSPLLHVKPEFAILKECRGSGLLRKMTAAPRFVHNHLSPSARRK